MAHAVRPETPAVELLRAVQALVRRFAVSERADVACCGLTVAQAATLEVLRAEPRLRLSELGRRLGITPSTLSRNLAKLGEGGLVAREDDADDARAARVSLSAAGRRKADELRQQEEAFAEDIVRRLPAARRDALLLGLQDLLGAVRAATEDCCPGAFDHLMEDFPRNEACGPKGGGCGC
jgi:DNA-binding MarR family transcriptional regulator